MNKNRPVNLQLTTMKFPITAIISIFHRISGFLIFLFVPFALWALHCTTTSQTAFTHAQQVFANPIIRFITWIFVSALLYHLVAGIRHLLMDTGVGEAKESGRAGAYIGIIIAIILIILAGIWLW